MTPVETAKAIIKSYHLERWRREVRDKLPYKRPSIRMRRDVFTLMVGIWPAVYFGPTMAPEAEAAIRAELLDEQFLWIDGVKIQVVFMDGG